MWNKRFGLVAIIAAAGLSWEGAVGQVAPPPPPAEKPERLTPPPPPPPRQARPAQARPQPRVRPAEEIAVPDIPYVPLVQRDAEGRVIRLDRSPDLAALKHNPTVGPATVERIRPALVEWKAGLERLVADNLDMIRDIDGGLFQTADLGDENQKVLLNEVFKLVISAGTPNNVLSGQKLLTPTQMNFQRKIVKEYNDAVSREVADDIKARIPGDDADSKKAQVLEVSRYSLANLAADAARTYRELLVAGAGLIDKAVARFGPTEEEKSAMAGPLRAVRAAGTEREKIDAMNALMDTLDLARQRDLMLAVLAERGPATVPELDDAGVKPDGAEPREDVDE